MMSNLLEVQHLVVRYGAIAAVRDISFVVKMSHVVSLIGANGAGKSTTLNAISGILRASDGSINFNGKAITRWQPDQIVKHGLVQVPEGRQIIGTMSVQENLEMGAYARVGGWLGTAKNLIYDRHKRQQQILEIENEIEDVFRRFPRLKERRLQRAGLLSGGEQQMLALGRALLASPILIMLDEPSMGLAPVLVNEVFAIIKDLKSEGKTILLVEQNARKALEVADYVYVLERGQLVKGGDADSMRDDKEIIEAYLG